MLEHPLRALCLSMPIVLLAVCTGAARADVPCEPDAWARSVLGKADDLSESCGFGEDCAGAKRGLLEAALAERPEDLFLHRALQNSFGSEFGEGEEGEEAARGYRERAAASDPTDLILHGLILHGRVLVASNDAGAVEIFDQALALIPDHPWAHLGRARAGVVADAEDIEGLEKYLTRFLDLCPSRLDLVARQVSRIRTEGFWAPRIEAFRRWLDGQQADSFPYERLSRLWALEFKVNPPQEHPAVRERIAADLGRVEGLGLTESGGWWALLKEGYELAGRAELAERAEEELKKRYPCSNDSQFAGLKTWGEAHPRLGEDAAEQERSERARSRFEAAGEWIETCPKSPLFWRERLESAAQLESVSDEEVLRIGERILAMPSDGGIRFSPPLRVKVAQAYLDRGLRLESLPPLFEEGLRAQQERIGGYLDLPGLPEEQKRSFRNSLAAAEVEMGYGAAEAWLAQERWDEGRAALEGARRSVDGIEVSEEGSGHWRSKKRQLAARGWRLSGRLAAAEERRVDAVAFYLEAARLTENDESREEIEEKIGVLWAALGGGGEALQLLAPRQESEEEKIPEGTWAERSRELPAFELPDLQGKTWRLTELGGKTVLANLWATWCGPCRQELPLFQKLYEKLRDREDIAIVTLNLDSNPGVILPYMEKNGFTFPVLLAEDYVGDVLESISIPRNWVVDGSGALLKEQLGFDATQAEAEWMEEMLNAVTEVKAAGG